MFENYRLSALDAVTRIIHENLPYFIHKNVVTSH